MQSATQTDGHAGALAVAVLGADAVLAGLPATPVQLAHACLRAGFDLAVPASWGDELVAAECLRALDDRRSPRPVVLCTCPLVRRELLGAGPDLAPLLVPIVPPPVAAARYLHALFGRDRVHVTYIGACLAGMHADIDARIEPAAFLAILARREIVPLEEPTVFDSVLPPDRRRYFSLPGGSPAPEHLWGGAHARVLVEIDGGDIRLDLADHLLSHECALIDLAPGMSCACSGVAPGVLRSRARAAAAATEPPRAWSSVIDAAVALDLADPICAGPCTESQSEDDEAPERAATTSTGAGETTLRPAIGRRRSPASGVRAISITVPVARVAGRSLPRAYVSRRRTQSEVERTPTTTPALPGSVESAPPVAAPPIQGNGRSEQPSATARSKRRTAVETATKPSGAATGRPRKSGDGSAAP